MGSYGDRRCHAVKDTLVFASPQSIFHGNGYNLSVAVYVGFIALAGMAAEIGVLVLSFIDMEIAKRRTASSQPLSTAEIREAAQSATSMRVHPVAMTAVSTMAGLVPIMLSGSTGSDVTHRIAAPMLGDADCADINPVSATGYL